MNVESAPVAESPEGRAELESEIDQIFDELANEYDYKPESENVKEVVLEALDAYDTKHDENQIVGAREKLEALLSSENYSEEADGELDEKLTTLLDRLFRLEDWHLKNFHTYPENKKSHNI